MLTGVLIVTSGKIFVRRITSQRKTFYLLITSTWVISKIIEVSSVRKNVKKQEYINALSIAQRPFVFPIHCANFCDLTTRHRRPLSKYCNIFTNVMLEPHSLSTEGSVFETVQKALDFQFFTGPLKFFNRFLITLCFIALVLILLFNCTFRIIIMNDQVISVKKAYFNERPLVFVRMEWEKCCAGNKRHQNLNLNCIYDRVHSVNSKSKVYLKLIVGPDKKFTCMSLSGKIQKKTFFICLDP